ncbi:centromere/kinetochore protein zw10 homolog [Odontomachus brunneus]|uniref:centromere/kinetochore protein zw10 homolog n=1 Tax=Odontomachus brunneus TaxID=486640 RepID=UPI0013F22A60|nr:centromere/kinetochore protein zw10 homolog [Odontomachus brunneus]XP_032666420.1 centromere/kinetochore protein zw10 homolog [Odontomachus brunneus]XP_032666421.1 centromere/kinetochore protein zw10 homolog [Odontomachus brunneus]
MTSFVADVLATAGKLEKLNLQKNIVDIQKEITKLEYEVRDFMDENYDEFSAKLTRDVHLVKKTEQLLEEINILQSRINDQIKVELSGSTKELKSLSQMLKESNISLQLSHQLIELHECMKSIRKLQEEKRFVDTTKTLLQMHSLLNNPNSVVHDLEIYTAIKNEYCELFRSCLTEISRLLRDRICWSSDVKDGKTITSVTIKSEYDDIQELIQGLHIIDHLENELKTFSTKLMEHIINPVIHDHCSVYVVKEKVFTVDILERKKMPCYKGVLYNLKLLFKFLHQHLNLKVADDETFLKRMQPHLLEQLSHSLTTDCISHTIPTSNADLKNFEPVVEAINEFQDYLVEIEFLSKDQLFLSEYTNNIDKLFIDRICQDLLVKVRNIIKKDLHDSVRYEPQEPPKLMSKAFEDDRELTIEKKLSDMSFQLPRCQISKSAMETLELARTILDEARDSSDACAVRLFYTCRNVFGMYAWLVPEHHRKFLDTIPQQVALFHNNCMYLAHHLLTLAHDYRDKFSKNLQKLNLTFADQVTVLRDVGSRYFLEHMRYQRNIIFDIIKDSGFTSLGQTPELHPSTERALRQCIRQLELLKTVWLDVLPINVYCKAVGCITNSMVDDLVTKVISVEDIPVDVARELVVLFNVVVKRAPQIFPDPSKIQRHVRKWGKFLELIRLLGASLKEIEVRWGNGKGPLAQEFTAPQVKQLIRALFQNTDRRSNLLASIR